MSEAERRRWWRAAAAVVLGGGAVVGVWAGLSRHAAADSKPPQAVQVGDDAAVWVRTPTPPPPAPAPAPPPAADHAAGHPGTRPEDGAAVAARDSAHSAVRRAGAPVGPGRGHAEAVGADARPGRPDHPVAVGSPAPRACRRYPVGLTREVA